MLTADMLCPNYCLRAVIEDFVAVELALQQREAAEQVGKGGGAAGEDGGRAEEGERTGDEGGGAAADGGGGAEEGGRTRDEGGRAAAEDGGRAEQAERAGDEALATDLKTLNQDLKRNDAAEEGAVFRSLAGGHREGGGPAESVTGLDSCSNGFAGGRGWRVPPD